MVLLNIILTSISVLCAVFCAYQAKRQADIQDQQLEQSKKPEQLDRSTNDRLQSIAIALQKIEGQLKDLNEKVRS